MTTINGLCVVCGRPAKFTCSLCGKLVCAAHYDADKKTCIYCKKGKFSSTGVLK